MEPFVAIVAIVAAGVVGVAVGFVVRGVLANQGIKSAQDKAARIVAEARAQQKDMILEAKDEKLRLQREAEDEARQKRSELTNLERRLLARDEQIDQRADMLEEKSRKINDREREIERQRDDLGRLNQERIAALEQVSGMSAEDAKGVLLEAIREEAEHESQRAGDDAPRRDHDERGADRDESEQREDHGPEAHHRPSPWRSRSALRRMVSPRW